MNREDRDGLLNAFRNDLVDDCLDKACDMEGVACYAQAVIYMHQAWKLPGTEDEIQQKIIGAIRLCGNKMFKGENASTTAGVIARAMDAVQSDYEKLKERAKNIEARQQQPLRCASGI